MSGVRTSGFPPRRGRAVACAALVACAAALCAGCQEDIQLLPTAGPECQVCSGDDCSPAPDGTACSIGMCEGGVCVSDACDSGALFEAVATGDEHTCALTRGGDLYCWGASDQAQLADGVIDPDLVQPVPTPIAGQDDWSQLSSTWSHACGVRTGNAAWCFGDNDHRQSALDPPSEGIEPTQVQGGAAEWDELISGDEHTCGLGVAGDLWCWGSNADGQLGVAGAGETAIPVQVADPVAVWRSASAGESHTCGVAMNDGSLWCWGSNEFGALGVDDDELSGDSSPTPARVDTSAQFTRVVAGGRHGCALDTSGAWQCWGRNGDGELGIDSPEDEADSPQPIVTGVRFGQLVLGDRHTCAIDQQQGQLGALWCWGRNDLGQLGLGAAGGSRDVPTQVSTIADWSQVAVGRAHTCAVRETGSLFCWGDNARGQLGLGDTAPRAAPVQVCPE